jgi:hypothetical protein
MNKKALDLKNNEALKNFKQKAGDLPKQPKVQQAMAKAKELAGKAKAMPLRNKLLLGGGALASGLVAGKLMSGNKEKTASQERRELMTNAFIEGFVKQAESGVEFAKSIGTAVAARTALGGAMGAALSTDKAKESSKTKAEASAKIVKDAKKARKENFGQYLLNPAVPGPITEAAARLARRANAAKAEHPYKSSLIPGYAALKGGKAGEKDVE